MEMMPAKLNRGFITTNGNESIEFASGHRILFKSRTNASGRGPRPQRIVFDEALVLKHDQVGSMAPGISAQRNPQIIFASSAPKADSEVLHSLRARAVAPEPGDRFFYAAWNNHADVDESDPESWYRVNPSLGYGRMTEDSLNANRRLMSHDEFRREHLGIPEDPIGSGNVAIPADLWESLADEHSSIDSHFAIALEVSPDRKFSSFAVAGRRDDGLFHIDIADRRAGTGWVVARAAELCTKWKTPIRIDKTSPAGAMVSLLVEAGVDVVEVTTADHAKATGQFIDACHSLTLRHLGGTYLRSAVAGAVLRATGDAELWSRRSSKVDVSPLVAATLALGGVPDVAPDTPFFVY
jgi:hypothetical protein